MAAGKRTLLYQLTLTISLCLLVLLVSFAITDPANGSDGSGDPDWSGVMPVQSGERAIGVVAVDVDGGDNVVVVWEQGLDDEGSFSSGEIRIREIYVVKYDNNMNLLWGPIRIGAARVMDNAFPALALDGSDNIHVLWADDGGSTIVYSALDPDGNAYLQDIEIVQNSTRAVQPAVGVDPDDHLNVVWVDMRPGGEVGSGEGDEKGEGNRDAIPGLYYTELLPSKAAGIEEPTDADIRTIDDTPITGPLGQNLSFIPDLGAPRIASLSPSPSPSVLADETYVHIVWAEELDGISRAFYTRIRPASATRNGSSSSDETITGVQDKPISPEGINATSPGSRPIPGAISTLGSPPSTKLPTGSWLVFTVRWTGVRRVLPFWWRDCPETAWLQESCGTTSQ
jgi:hypothetical protein